MITTTALFDFDLARCKGHKMELWFPEDDNYKSFDCSIAKHICSLCQVKYQCGEMAMERERHGKASTRDGIYGGMTPMERSNLDKARQKRPCGTDCGYKRHIHRHEPIDLECAIAHYKHEQTKVVA